MTVATTRSPVLHLSLILGGRLRDADGLRLGKVDDLITEQGRTLLEPADVGAPARG
jgi:hypothetical protein